MSEIGDMQQLLSTAQQIMDILNNTNTAVAKIEEKAPVIKENLGNFRQLERLALRWLTIARRMGLPEDIAQATQFISALIIMIRMLEISLNQLSKGPIGILIGIAGFVGVALSAYDLLRGGS